MMPYQKCPCACFGHQQIIASSLHGTNQATKAISCCWCSTVCLFAASFTLATPINLQQTICRGIHTFPQQSMVTGALLVSNPWALATDFTTTSSK